MQAEPLPSGQRERLEPAHWMARALQLAALGTYTTFPNPRVGCVIVREGRIVGEGWHERAGQPHAETRALAQAGERARGADAYVTLEPCAHHGRTPPCTDALLHAGVRRVWAAMEDPNPLVCGRGIARLRAAGVEVHTGLLEQPARALNRGFVSRMAHGRPYLVLKLATSLDGRTAMASGESRWITGAAARRDVHRLRAACGAVLTTSATALADDPALSVRLDADDPAMARQPDRIVLDRQARVPARARIWAPGARRLRITAVDAPAIDGVVSIDLGRRQTGGCTLAAAIAELANFEVNEVLVESGPRFAGALLQAQLVDELVIYAAPMLLGDAARPLAVLPGLARLAERVRLQYKDVRMVGNDLRIVATPAAQPAAPAGD